MQCPLSNSTPRSCLAHLGPHRSQRLGSWRIVAQGPFQSPPNLFYRQSNIPRKCLLCCSKINEWSFDVLNSGTGGLWILKEWHSYPHRPPIPMSRK